MVKYTRRLFLSISFFISLKFFPARYLSPSTGLWYSFPALAFPAIPCGGEVLPLFVTHPTRVMYFQPKDGGPRAQKRARQHDFKGNSLILRTDSSSIVPALWHQFARAS